MTILENDLTERQADFSSALAEQMDVLRYDKLNNGLVRFVTAPLDDFDVDLETVQINLPNGKKVARHNLSVDVRIKGFIVDQAGTLLGVQDMSNLDNQDGSPQWLKMDYTDAALIALQEGLS